MGSVKTLHIVGYKNSGKTTLINRWVTLLKEKGYRVVVIKHHGHGSKLAMPDEKKDSMTYLRSGAEASLVSGSGFTQHIVQRELTYGELIELATSSKPHIILVEGYKHERGDKVVLVRSTEDWETLQMLDGIQLVVGLEDNSPYQQISSRNESEQLDEWMVNYIEE